MTVPGTFVVPDAGGGAVAGRSRVCHTAMPLIITATAARVMAAIARPRVPLVLLFPLVLGISRIVWPPRRGRRLRRSDEGDAGRRELADLPRILRVADRHHAGQRTGDER